MNAALHIDVRPLFPDTVHSEFRRVADEAFVLDPQEQALIEGTCSGRFQQFSTGRVIARKLLREIGAEAGPLLKNSKGAPQWPDGVAGSITHTREWCGVAVALIRHVQGLGLDIEQPERMTRQIAERILIPKELGWIDHVAEGDGLRWATLFFSAKEAVYKALNPLTGAWIGFSDVRIIPDMAGRTFSVALYHQDARVNDFAPLLQGRFSFECSYVAAGVYICRK